MLNILDASGKTHGICLKTSVRRLRKTHGGDFRGLKTKTADILTMSAVGVVLISKENYHKKMTNLTVCRVVT